MNVACGYVGMLLYREIENKRTKSLLVYAIVFAFDMEEVKYLQWSSICLYVKINSKISCNGYVQYIRR